VITIRSAAHLAQVLACGSLLSLPALGATPTFTLTAGNVSLSGMGTGVSHFTLTSVNGFSGQVGVTCTGPDPNLLPDLVLPSCNHPVQNFVLPAGGSVSGAMTFYPPWTTQAKYSAPDPRRPGAPYEAPLGACAVAALAGLGLRGKARRSLLPLVLAAIALAGLAGCVGQGGLAMTPGTYAYVIAGGSLKGESATISVTVQ